MVDLVKTALALIALSLFSLATLGFARRRRPCRRPSLFDPERMGGRRDAA